MLSVFIVTTDAFAPSLYWILWNRLIIICRILFFFLFLVLFWNVVSFCSSQRTTKVRVWHSVVQPTINSVALFFSQRVLFLWSSIISSVFCFDTDFYLSSEPNHDDARNILSVQQRGSIDVGNAESICVSLTLKVYRCSPIACKASFV